MKRFLGIILVVCTLFACFTMSAGASGEDTVLRVGLYYGSGALEAPQLQNFVGSGYQAGYYSSDKAFHGFADVSETKVVMLKDEASYIKQSDDTYTEGTGGSTVGGYYVQLDSVYTSLADAQSAANTYGGFLVYTDSGYLVRTGHYGTLAEAQRAAQGVSGASAVSGSGNGVKVVETGTNRILLAYQGSGTFAMAPKGTNTQTWFKGFKYYGNFAYLRTAGSNITVINYVGLDDYVKGVVPYEMSASWHVEALKAQAVCARSYAIAGLNSHSSQGFDLCNTTDCQVYQGTNRATDNSDTAVEQTAGEYITVDGKAVQAYFFSSDGGATEDAANVWGGEYAYLKGKADPYEDTQNANNGVWSVTLTQSEVQSKLSSAGLPSGQVANIEVTERTALGNVLKVTVTYTDGTTFVIEKAKTRSTFGLNSQRFSVTGSGGSTGSSAANTGTIGGSILAGAQAGFSGSRANGSASSGSAAASFTFSGTGWGHHVGMSQYGAKAMAEQGFTYQDILNFYYTGITIRK